MRGLIIYVEAPEASAVSLALLPCDFAPPPYPGTFRFLLYLFTVIPVTRIVTHLVWNISQIYSFFPSRQTLYTSAFG